MYWEYKSVLKLIRLAIENDDIVWDKVEIEIVGWLKWCCVIGTFGEYVYGFEGDWLVSADVFN